MRQVGTYISNGNTSINVRCSIRVIDNIKKIIAIQIAIRARWYMVTTSHITCRHIDFCVVRKFKLYSNAFNDCIWQRRK